MDGRRPMSFELLGSLFRVLPEVCLSDYEAGFFLGIFWHIAYRGIGFFFQKGV